MNRKRRNRLKSLLKKEKYVTYLSSDPRKCHSSKKNLLIFFMNELGEKKLDDQFCDS